MWHYLYNPTTGKLISEASAEPSAGPYYSRESRFNPETEQWNTGTRAIEPRDLTPFITPVVTKAQARDVLKTLLETTPANWTAAQEKQALYAVLLFAFREALKGGNVY